MSCTGRCEPKAQRDDLPTPCPFRWGPKVGTPREYGDQGGQRTARLRSPALAAVPAPGDAPAHRLSTPVAVAVAAAGGDTSRSRWRCGCITITPYGLLYVLFLGVAAAVAFHGSGSRWAVRGALA